ncbi:MAG: YdcF family protein, partial [Acidobacteriota bacterium]
SSWHMRRTLQEFRRHYVDVSPCVAGTETSETLTLDDLVPNSRELSRATLMLHEWLGIAWYALWA